MDTGLLLYVLALGSQILPEALTCPCGVPPCAPQHITRECPLFYQLNDAIHTHGRTLPYAQLYSSVPRTHHQPLSFIQETVVVHRYDQVLSWACTPEYKWILKKRMDTDKESVSTLLNLLAFFFSRSPVASSHCITNAILPFCVVSFITPE
jgi:hypothetical protein